ncbi:MAG TPA: sn-glycerol-3-phosphate ABC transporter ATP-binding protein UgpC [Solirubrobacteraceae bacterium]|jgi:multiple sugar transport system ATP-binding protein|nr:sn-glycerol-3-phosphate ABC transporter ATP-binding protein UgpC [Solirubrobacteraceae bacterium]
MASISLQQVRKVYPNGYEAVHGLDLDIADGELMVVVGPSGCGKTTVLRMIAGLELVSSGDVRIGEEVVNDVAPRDRDVAMVFQNYALYPQMNVGANIGFGLQMRGLPKREVAARVQEAARVLGLTEILSRRPGQLSGGQRQRVAMGRAIVREPNVFLMDEPLSNLDAKLRVQMRAEVARVQRRIGVAAIYVTHDQTEAMTLGDRVAVMRDGHLQQCDRPQVLYDSPTNTFVASFIGSPAMNLFEGRVDADGAGISVGSQRIVLASLSAHPALTQYRDRPLVVGIRPEDLSVVNSEQPEHAVLEGDVELVEALGAEQLVHFRTDAALVRPERVEETEGLERAELSDSLSVARIDPRTDIAVATRIKFSFPVERVAFFDAATGLAIRP